MTKYADQSSMKRYLILGGIMALLAVALGAFGAHGLKDRVEADLLTIYETGAQYQMYHALGIVAMAVLMGFWKDAALLRWSGRLMFIGMILFSGSLYTMTFTGIRALGAITPLGGVAFIAGWACLIIAAYKRNTPSE